MNSEALWAQSAQQFQQIFGDSWAKALQSFQHLDLGGVPGKAPSVQLAPAKLQALQDQYMKEAQALYQRLGFRDIPAYREVPITDMRYLELRL